MNYVQRIPPRTRMVWGRWLLIIGIILGLLFDALSVLSNMEANAYWGGKEGTAYVPTKPVEARLASVRCPLILTSRNAENITVAIKNQIQDQITSPVQVYIRDLGFAQERSDLQRPQIGPGRTQEVTWPVKPEDAASSSMILARIFLYKYYPLPTSTASCGMLFIPTSLLSGNVISGLFISGLILCLGLGLVFTRSASVGLRDQKLLAANGLAILSASIVIILIANLLGYWLFSAFLFLLSFFIGLIFLVSAVQQSL